MLDGAAALNVYGILLHHLAGRTPDRGMAQLTGHYPCYGVYETRDAGASWTARGDGLPQEGAYLTILRQAFCGEGSGPTMGLYFGATSGDVFGSGDAGKTWSTTAANLPPVHSVRAA
jgi:photosystem II stability/assembly factor-like uncharacterized protein